MLSDRASQGCLRPLGVLLTRKKTKVFGSIVALRMLRDRCNEPLHVVSWMIWCFFWLGVRAQKHVLPSVFFFFFKFFFDMLFVAHELNPSKSRFFSLVLKSTGSRDSQSSCEDCRQQMMMMGGAGASFMEGKGKGPGKGPGGELQCRDCWVLIWWLTLTSQARG